MFMDTAEHYLKLEIDLFKIKRNYEKLKGFTGKEVSAVVKANAYGIGAIPISKALQSAGCHRFYVATVSEALTLREALGGAPTIYVFNTFTKSQIPLLESHKITPILTTIDQVKLWALGHRDLVLHFDTGMNRLSIPYHQLDECLSIVEADQVESIMSHLACADDAQHPLNTIQLDRFKEIARHFPKSRKSLSASKGINLGAPYLFDEVRVGIYLYGYSPSTETPLSQSLEPALQAVAQILNIESIEKGTTIGYGGTFKAVAPMTIGTIGVGYADGIPLTYSNKGYFQMAGHKLPILGRVSMDLITVDLTNLPSKYAKVGNWVDLIPDPMSFYEMSRALGSSPHEMLTRLGQRYKRNHINA